MSVLEHNLFKGLRLRVFGQFILALLLFASPAAASVVVFDTYPLNATLGGLSLAGAGISDSFVLSSDATINEVHFGVWLNTGETITQIDWAIGLTHHDNSAGGGSASVAAQFLKTVSVSDVYDASFSFADLFLTGGTYYLTLKKPRDVRRRRRLGRE
jgi:hypothetical protein